MQPYTTIHLVAQAGRLWLRLDDLHAQPFPAHYRARLAQARSNAWARWQRREAKYPPAGWLAPVADNPADR